MHHLHPTNVEKQSLACIQTAEFSLQLAELSHAANQMQACGQRNEAAWQQMAELNRRVGQINWAVQQFTAFPVVHHQAQ